MKEWKVLLLVVPLGYVEWWERFDYAHNYTENFVGLCFLECIILIGPNWEFKGKIYSSINRERIC
jgi:hypothetical protein